METQRAGHARPLLGRGAFSGEFFHLVQLLLHGGRIRGARCELQVVAHFAGGAGVVLVLRQNDAQQMLDLRVAVLGIQLLGLARTLFRRIHILEVVVGH